MKNLLLILFLALTCSAFAQGDIAFVKDNFQSDKDGYKEARNNMKEGDKIFDAGNTSYYNQALPFYKNAYAFNPNNAELNYKLGVCYLFFACKTKMFGLLRKIACARSKLRRV